DDPRAVRAERRALHAAPDPKVLNTTRVADMLMKLEQDSSRFGVHHRRRPLLVTGDDPRAVGAKRHGTPPTGDVIQLKQGLSAILRVPHLDLARQVDEGVPAPGDDARAVRAEGHTRHAVAVP